MYYKNVSFVQNNNSGMITGNNLIIDGGFNTMQEFEQFMNEGKKSMRQKVFYGGYKSADQQTLKPGSRLKA